jgi:predicted nucleic acid-binding protein
MIVVLDASAAIEIALNREFGKTFQELLSEAELVLAPDLFPSEITNVFWKYASYADLPVEKCIKGIDFCLDLIDDYIVSKSLYREVFSEGIKTKHSAYDLFYLVVARRHNATIITRDKKMMAIALQLRVPVAKQP